jgi:hypothetical protein
VKNVVPIILFQGMKDQIVTYVFVSVKSILEIAQSPSRVTKLKHGGAKCG